MAENKNKHGDGMIFNDDFLKEAYRAELDQLKASDELIKTTLNKCRMELETGKRKKSTKTVLGRAALRYGAPIAACLLALIVLLNYPMLKVNKSAENSARPQTSGMAKIEGDADQARPAEMPAQAPRIMMEERGYPVSSNKAEDDRAFDGMDYQSIGYSITSVGNTLSSMDFSHILTLSGEDMSPETIEAILEAYNSGMGTKYTCDDNSVLTVATLMTGGISADSLREASSFDDLLGEQQYHLLPLQNEKQNYILLPVVESATPVDDPSAAPLDIVISQEGRTWMSSKYSGIFVSHDHGSYLLSKEEHQQLVRDTFQAEQITDYKVVDINQGYDYVIIIEGDGIEYAIPHIETDYGGSLENFKAYPVRDVLIGLADSLESR